MHDKFNATSASISTVAHACSPCHTQSKATQATASNCTARTHAHLANGISADNRHVGSGRKQRHR